MAEPNTREPPWKLLVVIAVGLALAACGGVDPAQGSIQQPLAGADDDDDDDLDQPLGIQTEEVCFTVHNPGDPVPIPVTGTRYHRKRFGADTRVILVQHGAAGTRALLDGGSAGIEVSSSFVRRLAKAGYVVISWDRPGYGQSPYIRPPGFGFRLSPNSYASMTHEVVQQVKSGAYLVGDGACASGTPSTVASTSVILAGFSMGAGESTLEAARHHDVDGLIHIGWNNQVPPSSTGTRLFVEWVVPQILAGNDYVYFFRPGASGVSDDCVNAYFWLPGVEAGVPESECANSNLMLTPSGEFAATAALRAAVTAELPNLGPLPSLLVFAEFDRLVTGAHNDTGDPDSSGKEVLMWQATCNCDISTYTQPRSGHAMFLHESMPLMARAVVSWLREKGLSAEIE